MVDGQSQRKSNRVRSFHLRYLELCRSKNFTPLPEIKNKNNNNATLDFFGDKFKIDDWLLIIEALYYDQALQNVGIRLRRLCCSVLENMDTEKRARLYRNKPVIFTKFIFMGVIEAITNCLKSNRNLNTLALEALPLNENYIAHIAKGLASNDTLQTISFCRSSIGDRGCEILCNAIKCLPHIENVYMCNCMLTVEGAYYITDMIKFQKIYRYSEGWKNSLRYRDVDPDSIPGLKMVFVAQNPKIGDEGTKMITEILKEDVWIKVIDMEECGLTDIGAKYVLDCLELNQSLIEFNIRGNHEVNPDLLRRIKMQLGKDPDNINKNEKNEKLTISNVRERMKLLEEQVATEKQLRKQVEILNEQLHEQIMSYEKQLHEKQKIQIPEGVILVEQDAWDDLIKERNDLKNAVSTLKATRTRSYSKKTKLRKAKSEIAAKMLYERCKNNKCSKSEHEMVDGNKKTTREATNAKVFIERSIGDTKQTEMNRNVNRTTAQEAISNKSLSGMDALKIFMSAKGMGDNARDFTNPIEESARSLFMGGF